MGQAQQPEARTPYRQGSTAIPKPTLRSLSADITLYHRATTFLSHTVYPLDPNLTNCFSKINSTMHRGAPSCTRIY